MLYDVVIVGAGFTGLTAGYELAKQGHKVRIIESDKMSGGLAGTFEFSDGVTIEKFYHHWFNSDNFVSGLVDDLGMKDDIILLKSNTGMYFNGQIWKLSSPLDLLRFTALSIIDRIRLGLLVFKVRKIKDWRAIEHLSIREWLESLCGRKVYQIVWEPLIKSKFSLYADSVSAVWMWKKLVLRGSTRTKKGVEELAYFKGGFGRLAENLVLAIQKLGGDVTFNEKVTSICPQDNRLYSLLTNKGEVKGRQFLFTPSFQIIAEIFLNKADPHWLLDLKKVKYLGNKCLVLRLKQSLSHTYWLNVNDPGFPFVGVIEHTNFDSPENYKGSHIAFLSRYLSVEDTVWTYSDEEYLELALSHLKRMFPKLEKSWVLDYKIWHAEYAQPVTEKNYSQYVPGINTPFKNGFISTMAQIYPEDRGTNYAIREGKKAADLIQKVLTSER